MHNLHLITNIPVNTYAHVDVSLDIGKILKDSKSYLIKTLTCGDKNRTFKRLAESDTICAGSIFEGQGLKTHKKQQTFCVIINIRQCMVQLFSLLARVAKQR